LYHRNPMQAPAIEAATRATSRWFWRNAIAAYANVTMVTVPAARPSSPSVRFTVLLAEVTMTITSRM
jgi:hypothetical protein